VTRRVSSSQGMRGVSLVELMVALVIGLLVSLAAVQIFAANRISYQMQEGLSRVQENGRFAAEYLQRRLRLAGFMGCGNDVVRSAGGTFVNHLAASGSEPRSVYRFERPVEGFAFRGNADGAALAVGDASEWTPALPAELDRKVVRGSDVIIVRTLSEESTPVIAWISNPNKFSVADPAFVAAGGFYAVQNCTSTELFQAVRANRGVVEAPREGQNVFVDPTTAPQVPWGYLSSKYGFPAGRALNAEVHRAEYTALYVGLRSEGGQSVPALFVQRFGAAVAGAATVVDDELADGVESLQLQYGVDDDPASVGTVDRFVTADQVVAGATGAAAIDARWRRVLGVRAGFLIRSPTNADLRGDTRTYFVAGKKIDPRDDQRLRQVYEVTVALRNRIFNS
jgi:type IV pilus assembly protein PilW